MSEAMGPDCCHTVEERWSAREGRAACMAAHGCRTGVLDSTNGFRYKGSDADDSRADDWRNTSRGDKRTRGLHAICARWGVSCTAADGGRRAIFQVTAALMAAVDIIRDHLRALCFCVFSQIQRGAASTWMRRAVCMSNPPVHNALVALDCIYGMQ